MSKKETGGPAFPIPLNPGETYTAGTQGPADGMTLRDYFAAQALMGFMASTSNPRRFHPDEDAAYFYALADAMIKERAK